VPAHGDRVDGLVVDVPAAEADLALEAKAANQIVHAIDAAQHGALTAAGRADEGCDGVLLDAQVSVAHRFEVAVVQRVQLDIDDSRMSIARAVDLCGRGLHAVHGNSSIIELICVPFVDQALCDRAVQICAAMLAISTRKTSTSDADQAISIWLRK